MSFFHTTPVGRIRILLLLSPPGLSTHSPPPSDDKDEECYQYLLMLGMHGGWPGMAVPSCVHASRRPHSQESQSCWEVGRDSLVPNSLSCGSSEIHLPWTTMRAC